MIQLQYSITRGELASWYWRSIRRNRRHRRLWLLSVVGWAVLAFIYCRWTIRTTPVSSLASAIVVGGLVACLLALYPQLRFRAQIRTLTVGPEGLSTTIAGRSEHYPWSKIAAVEDTGDRIVITNRNLNAFLVPARAFSSADHRAEFLRATSAGLAGIGSPSAA